MIPRRITRRFTQLMEANIERLLLILGEHHKETHGISEADIQAKEQSLGFPLPTTCGNIIRFWDVPHISPKGVITNMNRSCCRTCSFLMILFHDRQGVPGLLSSGGVRDLLRDPHSGFGAERSPVYLCAWNLPDWRLENRSLQRFLAGKALVQLGVEDRSPYWAILMRACGACPITAQYAFGARA